MSHTFIILDGHPNVFAPTTRNTKEKTDPTQQLPLLPLWANMVQASIEFCRVTWDLQHLKRYLINVLIAGETPILLNDLHQQSIQQLESQFPHAQPRQAFTHDRLQAAIEYAFRIYSGTNNNEALRRCRIVILAVAKQSTEKSFEFRNNPDDPARDLRTMVYKAIENTNTLKIDHVQVDILRLLPYVETPETPLPHKITSKRISSQLTMSVYNIPNGQDDLKYAMRHLAQLYYNVHVLHISNIPMKSAEQAQITRTITLYYQANGHHLINQQEPIRNFNIHDPAYLKYRELKLIYSKRSKRALPEHEWCTCMHSISPLKLHDLATQVFLDMTFQGSISYLVTNETKAWTHILMAQNGAIFLHCLNSQLQQQFSEAEKDLISLSNVKIEGMLDQGVQTTVSKTSELADTILRPNSFETVKQYLETVANNPLCKTVPLNPSRFSHHLPITHKLSEKNTLYTSRSIEKATRWRTCFRDCEGTDRFPITLDDASSIEDVSMDVLNGIPNSSGFGVAIGLVRDLLEQLQDILLKDKILDKEIKPTKELVSMIVVELVNGMEGLGQKLFIKGLPKQEAKLVSKKLLVALYLVGKRFANDSNQHRELCAHIISTIKERTEYQLETNKATQIKKEEAGLDDVWNQVTRYENMSLREREEAAQGILPDIKQEKQAAEPILFAGQLPPQLLQSTPSSNTKFNPSFRSRRGGQNTTTAPSDPRQHPLPSTGSKKPTYPDPSAAVPYLTYISPTLEEKADEERQEENSLGNPGNLLWLYWMHQKAGKRGNQEEGDLNSGTELVHKNNVWKRVKKEFQGRLAQAGEKGEML